MAAELKDVINQATHAPGGVRGMGSSTDAVARVGARLVVLEGGAELGAGGVGIAAAVGEILADLGGWAVVLLIIGLIISMKETEFMLSKLCDAIPFNRGDPIKAIIHAIFRPVDDLEGWAYDRMRHLATNIVVNWVHGFKQFMEYQFGVQLGSPGTSGGTEAGVPGTGTATVPGTGGLATVSQVSRVQREINDIYRRLSAEDARIANIEQHTGVVLLPAPGVQPLQQRVQRLENIVTPLVHDANALHADLVRVNANVQIMQDELRALRQNLNAVRAVQFGVQDVLNDMQYRVGLVQGELNQLLPQVDAHARTLHVLHPLQGLLYLGAVGIQNLQKLEKNPCQCPSFPGISGSDSGFLAAYEFLTNG